MPLDVDKGIELPQLELISTKNDDCTTEYSTGERVLVLVLMYFRASNAAEASKIQEVAFKIC